jgi:hypothetical protein
VQCAGTLGCPESPPHPSLVQFTQAQSPLRGLRGKGETGRESKIRATALSGLSLGSGVSAWVLSPLLHHFFLLIPSICLRRSFCLGSFAGLRFLFLCGVVFSLYYVPLLIRSPLLPTNMRKIPFLKNST